MGVADPVDGRGGGGSLGRLDDVWLHAVHEMDDVELAVDMLKLLADPTRIRILWALLHGEHCVNDWPTTSAPSRRRSPNTWRSYGS